MAAPGQLLMPNQYYKFHYLGTLSNEKYFVFKKQTFLTNYNLIRLGAFWSSNIFSFRNTTHYFTVSKTLAVASTDIKAVLKELCLLLGAKP